jgi:hypothetical protein
MRILHQAIYVITESGQNAITKKLIHFFLKKVGPQNPITWAISGGQPALLGYIKRSGDKTPLHVTIFSNRDKNPLHLPTLRGVPFPRGRAQLLTVVGDHVTRGMFPYVAH